MKTRLFLFAAVATASCAAILTGCEDKEPPVPVISIVTQPTAPPSALIEGSITGSLTIAATATEGAALTYQWYGNTTASNTGGTAISGATSATYTLPATLTAGTYYYFCEVGAKGAKAVRSSVVTVTVNESGPPTPTDTITFTTDAVTSTSQWNQTINGGISVHGSGTATIDWGDGSDPEQVTLTAIPEWINTTPNAPHTFTEGTKTVTITGNVTALWTGWMPLSAIDVRGMPSLEYLDLQGSENLTALDVSNNTALTFLDVAVSNIGSITGLKNLDALEGLRVGENPLTALDISGMTSLQWMSYDGGPRTLASIDVTGCTNIEMIILSGVSADPSNIAGLGTLTALNDIAINWNGWSADRLAAVFTALPDRTGESPGVITGGWDHTDVVTTPGLDCTKNPGWDALTPAQQAIATAKNWTLEPTPAIVTSDDILTAANFPDANFLACLKTEAAGRWGDKNGELTAAEAATVTGIDVWQKNIASLVGIEFFTGLTWLDCDNNGLTSLDLSRNKALTELWCSSNKLTSLDLSQNKALTELWCSSNKLTSLDVSENKALTDLYCSSNLLTSLDIRVNTALTALECGYNPGDGVRVLPVMVWIGFDTDSPPYGFTTDWWGHTGEDGMAIIRAAYYDVLPVGIITETNFPDPNFRAYCEAQAADRWGNLDGILTAAEAAKVTGIGVSGGTVVKITDLTGIEHFTGLTTLGCSDNDLTSLDLSANTELIYLNCENNRLSSLDLSANTKLEDLSGGSPRDLITSLDLTNNKNLWTIHWPGGGNNSLTSLIVSGLTKLEHMYISYHHNLLSLDVSGCTALEILECEAQGGSSGIGGGFGNMTTLNAAGCASLYFLKCYSHQISSLTLTGCTALEFLDVGQSRLTSFDASGLPALNWLNVSLSDLAQSRTEVNAMIATLPARTGVTPGKIRFSGNGYSAAYYSFSTTGPPYYSDAIPNINAYLSEQGKNWTWGS